MSAIERPAEAAVTTMLHAWRRGDPQATELLLDRVYSELRRLAAAQLRAERVGHTLQPTALVHEVYLRLFPQRTIDWRDRAHFFGLAATMMRRVLVDYARARRTQKRRREDAAGFVTVVADSGPEVEVLDLDRVLCSFAVDYPRQARVVEMRYFGDLEIEAIAACLCISTATVKRDWVFARAWLRAALEDQQ